jgi:hypothetical protein
VVPISAEEAADREHAREVRDVMKALTQMPRGLPTALWGKDMSQLAREIVDGERRKEPDGTELVLVDGKWYEADHNNLGRFLREHKEEAAGTGLSARERAKRLEQLEERLLEGRISEETYERLRDKYSEQGGDEGF